MSKIKYQIKIIDWAGNVLFEGHFEDPEAIKTIDANRCNCFDICDECDGSGFKNNFHVEWADGDRDDNVYEFINY